MYHTIFSMNNAGGIVGSDITGMNFAPVNFLDADEMRPTSAMFDVIGNGSETPYTDAMNGIIQEHVNSMRENLDSAKNANMHLSWKRRLRNFITNENNNLLSTLKIPINTHPAIERGDSILRMFGTLKHFPKAMLREVALDMSGADIISEINQTLQSMNTANGIDDHIKKIKYLCDEYRLAGENALKSEIELKRKMESIDKAYKTISGILDLNQSESYNMLMEATEKYLGEVYRDNNIENEYKLFIEAYRRFIYLKDVIAMTRSIESCESEPMCIICLNDSVSYTLSPCGHTYCSTCIKKQLHSCFVCRGLIRDRVKLFFC